METGLGPEDRKRVEESIRKKYARVSKILDGLFTYPTGRAGLEALRYDPRIIQSLPETVLASYCRVENPFSLGPIHEGEAVLDRLWRGRRYTHRCDDGGTVHYVMLGVFGIMPFLAARR